MNIKKMRDEFDRREPQPELDPKLVAACCFGLMGWLLWFAALANLLEWW